MKQFQKYCMWMLPTILIIVAVGLFVFVVTELVAPVIFQIEQSGLKSLIEGIWCGKNGCE